MRTSEMIQTRIEPPLKNKAEAILKVVGLTSMLVVGFITQCKKD